MTDRDAARRLLRELLPEMLDEALGGRPGANGHRTGNGRAHPAPAPADGLPQVPAPPVAAVLRPSTWREPALPGEVIGDGGRAAPPPAAAGTPAPGPAPGVRAAAGTEWVTLDSDEDLDRFVRGLLARFENPRDRMAIRSGALRFFLRRAPAAGAAPAGAVHRVDKGAVTERAVKQAADAGARLVLGPRAVLTPLGREKARSLGVEVERERRC